jgi:hypothetical protein
MGLDVTAQNKIKGTVVDQFAKPIQNAKISVNNGDFVYTSSNGEFAVNSSSNNEKLYSIKADKPGLIIKDWNYSQGEVKVVMTQPKRVRGRVLTVEQVPLAHVNVLVAGIKGLNAVKTDKKGFFDLEVPEGFPINERSPFIVYDPGRLKSQSDFEKTIGEDGLVYIFVKVPPRKVRKVKVLQNLKPIQAKVFIDQIAINPMKMVNFLLMKMQLILVIFK